MTTVLYTDYRLYCDSLVVKGTERFQSLTKIVKFPKPLKISSKNHKPWNDTVYGWVCTGVPDAAQGVMNDLVAEKGDVDRIISYLDSVVASNLSNEDNSFTVFMVGRKHNFCLQLYSEQFSFQHYGHHQNITLGAGGDIVKEAIKEENAHPVRAFFKAFYRWPEVTGGMIDMWELEKNGKDPFNRYGVYHERQLSELPAYLIDLNAAVIPDLISPLFSARITKALIEVKVDERVEAFVAELEREIKQARPPTESATDSTNPSPTKENSHEQAKPPAEVPGQDLQGSREGLAGTAGLS